MQDRLLAMVRGKGKRYMVSSEKEMSFMTELMRRKGGGAALTYEEYRRELNEALEKADWMNPRDKNGPAYRVLARAARDKAPAAGPVAEAARRILRKDKEMKKKLSLTEKISLAENNAVDFMHACVTIALHDEYEVGVCSGCGR